MEMKDSLSHGILDMQTNILEEIREIRRRDEMRHNIEQMEKGARAEPSPVDTSAISPVSGISVNDPLTMAQLANGTYQNDSVRNSYFRGEDHYKSLSDSMPEFPDFPEFGDLSDPFSYSSIVNYSTSDKLSMIEAKEELRSIAQQQYAGVRNTASSLIGDFTGLDATRMSSEDISKHFARREQGVQNLTAEMAGGAIGLGGSAASLFMPLGTGLVVGAGAAYAASEFTQGAKAASNYQEILLQDGYKAFNAIQSTGDMGAIGIGRDDRKELSRMMRHVAVDNFMDDEELSKILQGALDFKLLRSAQDAETFENKFKELVNTTRKLTTTLGLSIEEAVAMMDDFNRAGVLDADVAGISAFAKVGASFLGEDSSKYTKNVLEQASSIVQGTSVDAGQVAKSLTFNAYAMSAIEDYARDYDPQMLHLIKNSGGIGTVANDMESRLKDYLGSNDGANHVLSTFGDAIVFDERGPRLDVAAMNQIADSGQVGRERYNEAQNHLRTLTPEQMHLLTKEIGQIIYRDADYAEISKMMDVITESKLDIMPEGTERLNALVELGMFNDNETELARLYDLALKIGTDDASRTQFSSLAINEQITAAQLIQSPGFMNKIKYGFKKHVGMPIGDVGQSFSDMTGDWVHGINSAIRGVDGRSPYDISPDVGLTVDDFEERFSEDRLRERYEKYGFEGVEDTDFYDFEVGKIQKDYLLENARMSDGSYNRLMSEAVDGGLSFSEQARLKELVESGEVTMGQKAQINNILDEAADSNNFFKSSGRAVKIRLSKMKFWGNDTTEDIPGISTGDEIIKRQEEIKEELPKQHGIISKEIQQGNYSDSEMEELWMLMNAIGTDDFDLGAVRDIAGEGDVYDAFARAVELNELAADTRELESIFAEDVMTTQMAMDGTAGMYAMLQVSGAYTEDIFSQAYGNDQKKLLKKVKKDKKAMDKMSDAEIAQLSAEYKKQGLQIMEGFSDYEMGHIVTFLDENVAGLNVEDLMKEDGTIDRERSFEEVTRIIGSSKSGDSAARAAILGEGSERKGIGGGLGASIAKLDQSANEVADAISVHTDTITEFSKFLEGEHEILHRSMSNMESTRNHYTTSRMGR